MQKTYRILFLGDIVSRVGRQAVTEYLPRLREKHQVDFTFANAENLAGGRGVTPNTVDEMLNAGIDYFTSGNHVFYTNNWGEVLTDTSYRVLRPLNYPSEIPGKGMVPISTGKEKLTIWLLNLITQEIDKTAQNPFRVVESALSQIKAASSSQEAPHVIILDFHSERSSTKRAMGFYLDGKVSAVLGTHTHVPTADTQILPKGTGFVSDIGMVGPLNSVLGVESNIIIQRHRLPYPQQFEWVKTGPVQWNSVLLELNGEGKTTGIKRLDFTNLDTKGNR